MIGYAYIKLLRPANSLMASVGVLIGWLLITKSITISNIPSLLFAMIATFIITGAGNAFNDYIDIESDKINRPDRPIPSGDVSKNKALIYALILFVSGIILSATINYVCLIIAVINSMALILYSYTLQNKMFIGNIAVGYLVGSTFLFGGAAAGNILLPGILALLAFLSNVSREIIKDLEDLEGDRQGFLKKLIKNIRESIADRFKTKGNEIRLKYTETTAIIIAIISLMVAVMLSFLPYYLNLLGIHYLVVVSVADAIFIWCIYRMGRAKKRSDYGMISKRMKIAMLISLIAFITGILF